MTNEEPDEKEDVVNGYLLEGTDPAFGIRSLLYLMRFDRRGGFGSIRRCTNRIGTVPGAKKRGSFADARFFYDHCNLFELPNA